MIAAAKDDLRPAGPDAINIAVRDVLSGLPSKKQAEGDAQSALLVYRIGLKDLPLDLLRLACVRAASTLEWRPPPAVLTRLVGEEFAERRRRLTRLEDAERNPPAPERVISDSERAEVIAGLAALKDTLDIRNRAAAAALAEREAAGPVKTPGGGSAAVVAAALAASRAKVSTSQPEDDA
jgi:hypothetical protein